MSQQSRISPEPLPVPPQPAVDDNDWERQRSQGRYTAGVATATVICLDCGCIVHVAYTDRHDLFHDGGDK